MLQMHVSLDLHVQCVMGMEVAQERGANDLSGTSLDGEHHR